MDALPTAGYPAMRPGRFKGSSDLQPHARELQAQVAGERVSVSVICVCWISPCLCAPEGETWIVFYSSG